MEKGREYIKPVFSNKDIENNAKVWNEAFNNLINDFTRNEEQINRILEAFGIRIEKHASSTDPDKIMLGKYYNDEFDGNFVFECNDVNNIKALTYDGGFNHCDITYSLNTFEGGSQLVPERRITINRGNDIQIDLVFRKIPISVGDKKEIESVAIELYNPANEFDKTIFYDGTDSCSIMLEDGTYEYGAEKDYAKRTVYLPKNIEDNKTVNLITYHEYHHNNRWPNFTRMVRYQLKCLFLDSIKAQYYLNIETNLLNSNDKEHMIPLKSIFLDEERAIYSMLNAKRPSETIDTALSQMKKIIPTFDELLKLPDFKHLNQTLHLLMKSKNNKYLYDFVPREVVEGCNLSKASVKKLG